MNDAPAVQHLNSSEEVSGVASYHVFRQSLLSYAPQSTLMTVFHEEVELGLRGRGREGEK